MPSQIFISYRRSDAGGHAGRLHDRLVDCFEPDVVFYDLESIDGGSNFPDRLNGAVDEALAVLVLIGPDWLRELKRRATLPDVDYVQHEVHLALQRRAATRAPLVLPVLLGGAQPPAEADLPEPLRPLSELNSVVFQGTQADWNFKFAQLLELLAAVPGMPTPDPPAARRRRWPWAVAAGLAVAGVAAWSGLQARTGVADAAERLRIGRYDLALQRLQALPLPARWWPGVRFASQKAQLGESQFEPRPDWERLSVELKRLLAQAPDDNDLLVLRAQNEVGEGQWEAARKTIDQATASDPRNAEAWFVRASVLDANGDLKLAEADYRKAVALAGESPHYRSNLAHAQLEDGRLDEAIASYERVKRFPLAPLEQAKAHWARGEFALAAEQQQSAIGLLQQPDVAGDRFNSRPWIFYAHRTLQLGPQADKLCYARWALAASQRLARPDAPPQPLPGDCAGAVCVLDFDLERYVPERPEAARQAAAALRRELGDTARCAAQATTPPPADAAASAARS